MKPKKIVEWVKETAQRGRAAGKVVETRKTRAKFCDAVREAVNLNNLVFEKLMNERNAILRAAGGKVTATKDQHRPSSHWSHQSHKDGSETYQIDP